MRRAVTALVALAATTFGGLTLAADAERPVVLEWERARGAESCVTREDLARAVEAHAERPLFADGADAPVHVRGRVARANGGWRATLSLTRRDGRRGSDRTVAVRSGTCRGLDDALVLVLSVALEPLVSRERDVPAEPVTSEPVTSEPITSEPVAGSPVTETKPATQTEPRSEPKPEPEPEPVAVDAGPRAT